MSIRGDGWAVSGVRTQLSATASPKVQGGSATARRTREAKAKMDEGTTEARIGSSGKAAAAMALGEGDDVASCGERSEAGDEGATCTSSGEAGAELCKQ